MTLTMDCNDYYSCSTPLACNTCQHSLYSESVCQCAAVQCALCSIRETIPAAMSNNGVSKAKRDESTSAPEWERGSIRCKHPMPINSIAKHWILFAIQHTHTHTHPVVRIWPNRIYLRINCLFMLCNVLVRVSSSLWMIFSSEKKQKMST